MTGADSQEQDATKNVDSEHSDTPEGTNKSNGKKSRTDRTQNKPESFAAAERTDNSDGKHAE
jgi:hypothetical protein